MENYMKKNLFLILVFLVSFSIFVFIPVTAEIDFYYKSGGDIWFKNSKIQLRYDSNMYCKVFYNKDEQLLSLNDENNTPLSLPSHFICIDGTAIKDFVVDYNSLKCDNIKTNLGNGKRLVLRGIANGPRNSRIEKILTIELYEEHPYTAITYASYRNLSENEDLNLTDVYSNCYRLDASLVDSSLKPNEMHTFYGTNGRPFPQIDTIIPDNFRLENYIGRNESLEGVKRGNGGIPIIDVWCKKMGIGIGHIEPVWKNLYLPIKIQDDGKVMIAVREEPALNLLKPYIIKKGETFNTVKTFVNVHSLDFYNTMEQYSELMNKQGINMHPEYTDDDYFSMWVSWNSYCVVGMASMYDVVLLKPVLEHMKDLHQYGIKMMVFDAGWFNNQGDWKPNPDPRSFPNGEEDLKKAIDEIHKNGYKVMLWISFLTAHPWSEVAKSNPDWMIQKANGQNHLDRWGGYTMCPSLPDVQEYHKKLARRLVGEYKADAFKVDGMYNCPPCYNPKHNHKNPNESSEDYYKVFKAFYEEAKSINPNVTVMVCPCGTICGYDILPYVSQTIAADPSNCLTVRRFGKLYRALKGANSPYSSDYTDVKYGLCRLPTAVGCGTVPQVFYGEKPDKETDEWYKKWFNIYNREMVSKGEYINLYDIYYDMPETHLIKKSSPEGNIYYYSMYANEYNGKVELRGLPKGKQFRIIDYPNDKELGVISGNSPFVDVAFKDYLLIKCVLK